MLKKPAVILLISALVFVQQAPVVLATTLTTSVFSNALGQNWQLGGWGNKASVQKTGGIGNSKSVKVTHLTGWSGFAFEHRTPEWGVFYIEPSTYTHVSFSINAGTRVSPALKKLYFDLDNGSDGVPLSNYVNIAKPNTWYKVRIPLADCNNRQQPYIRLTLFDFSDLANFSYTLDNVRLENDGTIQPSPAQPPAADGTAVNAKVDTMQNRLAISPYIYGDNEITLGSDGAARLPSTGLVRYGGNRWTAYNYENNASNAGSDWGPNQSDGYLSESIVPAEAVKTRVQNAFDIGSDALITVPIVDYVAADKNGVVSTVASDTNARWVKNLPRTSGALPAKPVLADRAVYQDQFVKTIQDTFGSALSAGRKIFYSLDNEPALWPYTHALVHPGATTYSEMADRTVKYASMIKDYAPASLVFGAVAYGYYEFVALQGAPDQNGRDYLDFLLDTAREAGQKQGRRIVDVLDIHWYPEATGGGQRVVYTGVSANPTAAEVEARLQAPRSLWDPTYSETSWVRDVAGGPIRLLPWLKDKIAVHYPGTKIAVTEYNYGGADDISGGLAQADVLGIFGREGVYAANLWSFGYTSANSYTYGGFDLYLNYDGQKSRVGNTSVLAQTSDVTRTSVYATVNDGDENSVFVTVVNKDANNTPMNISVKHPKALTTAYVYTLAKGSTKPAYIGQFPVSNNTLTYTMPARTASTIVFK